MAKCQLEIRENFLSSVQEIEDREAVGHAHYPRSLKNGMMQPLFGKNFIGTMSSSLSHQMPADIMSIWL